MMELIYKIEIIIINLMWNYIFHVAYVPLIIIFPIKNNRLISEQMWANFIR